MQTNTASAPPKGDKYDIPKSMRDRYPDDTDEQILFQFCQDSLKCTSEGMSPLWSAWEKYDAYWNGDQKRGDSKYDMEWQDKTVLNKIYTYGEQKVALLTDVRPSFDVYAINDDDPAADATAKGVTKYIRYDLWEKMQIEQCAEEVVRDMIKKNIAFMEVGWDPDANNGAGGEYRRYLDPRWVRTKPILDNWSNLDLLVVITPEDTEQLKRRVPDHKDIVRSDWSPSVYQEYAAGSSDSFLSEPSTKTPTSSSTANLTQAINNRLNNAKGVSKLIRVFWRDQETRDTVTEVEMVNDPEGQQIPVEIERSVLRYPTWRETWLHNNKVVLDRPLMYEYATMPNIIPCILNKTGNSIYTVSPLTIQVEEQDLLNKTERIITDNERIHGSGQWVIDIKSGLTHKSVFTAPDHAIEWNSGNGGQPPRRELGEACSPSLLQLATKRYADLKEACDMTDSIQGIREKGVTAGVAIDLLQQIGQAKIRKLGRALEIFYGMFGQYMVAIIRQYRTETIQRRYIGDTGELEQYGLNMLAPDGSRVNDVTKYEYEFVVVPNTVLPANKRVSEDRLMWLHQAGIIDGMTVLEQLDFPHINKVAERMAAKQQAEMEQMMMAQQQEAMQAQQGPSPEYNPVE